MEVAEEIEIMSPAYTLGLAQHEEGNFELNARVEQLETEVRFLQRELRLMRLKFRTADPNGIEYQQILEKTFLRLLDNQDWTMSRVKEDHFEGQPGNYKRTHPSNNTFTSRYAVAKKKKVIEIEVTSEEDEDINEQDYKNLLEVEESESEDVKYNPPNQKSGKKKRHRLQKKTNLKKWSKFNTTSARKVNDTVIKDGDVAVILDTDEPDSDSKELKDVHREDVDDDEGETKMDSSLTNIEAASLTKIPDNVEALFRYAGPDPKRPGSHKFRCRVDECESELTIKAKTQGYGNLYKHAKKRHGILKVVTPRVKSEKRKTKRKTEEVDDDSQPPELDNLISHLVGI